MNKEVDAHAVVVWKPEHAPLFAMNMLKTFYSWRKK